MEQKEIWIKSSVDQTMQPSLYYKALSREKRPLIVALHTWSFDRFNLVDLMLPVAEKYDFNGKHDPVVPVSQSMNFYHALWKEYPKASCYLDIFDGGHEIDMSTAMHWIISQYKKTEKNKVTG